MGLRTKIGRRFVAVFWSLCLVGCGGSQAIVDQSAPEIVDTGPDLANIDQVAVLPDLTPEAVPEVDTGLVFPEVEEMPDFVLDVGDPWGDWNKPCAANSDCTSGYCLQLGVDEAVCTVACLDECPGNWYCKGVETPPDWTFLCIPPSGNVCKPCQQDADCIYKGDLCIPVGDEGTWCGADCSAGQPCPENYSCVDLAPEGIEAMQCKPDTGSCVCTADLLDTAKACSNSNGFGTCEGESVCNGPAGWSECDAKTPESEDCNGVDDDCDGDVDEGLAPKPCKVENEYGTCNGTAVCGGADGWFCDAPVPAVEKCDGVDSNCNGVVDEGFTGLPEACDGMDNDCDGLVDEGYADSDGDKEADCYDPDDDNDGSPDIDDCQPLDPLAAPGKAEVCDGMDNDCDGIADNGFPDEDKDGIADCVDKDSDGDGVSDNVDNCVATPNPSQTNNDNDALGDACDPDDDNDGVGDDGDMSGQAGDAPCSNGQVVDCDDNCPYVPNQGQGDMDGDQTGDACDPDKDGDQVANEDDCGPGNGAVYPGAPELCNSQDDNCNGLVDEGYVDTDFDKVADCMDPDDDGDGDPDLSDCQPLNPAVHSQMEESCDGVDNNCDGITDEQCPPADFQLRQVTCVFTGEADGTYVRMVVGDVVSGTIANPNNELQLRWGSK